jgi:hypothetical protein
MTPETLFLDRASAAMDALDPISRLCLVAHLASGLPLPADLAAVAPELAAFRAAAERLLDATEAAAAALLSGGAASC